MSDDLISLFFVHLLLCSVDLLAGWLFVCCFVCLVCLCFFAVLCLFVCLFVGVFLFCLLVWCSFSSDFSVWRFSFCGIFVCLGIYVWKSLFWWGFLFEQSELVNRIFETDWVSNISCRFLVSKIRDHNFLVIGLSENLCSELFIRSKCA